VRAHSVIVPSVRPAGTAMIGSDIASLNVGTEITPRTSSKAICSAVVRTLNYIARAYVESLNRMAAL